MEYRNAVSVELKQFLDSGKYIPPFMRDFHYQKSLFKYIQTVVKGENADSALTLSWVDAQIYTTDIFLYIMAKHGYTLQKNRKVLPYFDIDVTVAEFDEAQNALKREIFKTVTESPPSPPPFELEEGRKVMKNHLVKLFINACINDFDLVVLILALDVTDKGYGNISNFCDHSLNNPFMKLCKENYATYKEKDNVYISPETLMDLIIESAENTQPHYFYTIEPNHNPLFRNVTFPSFLEAYYALAIEGCLGSIYRNEIHMEADLKVPNKSITTASVSVETSCAHNEQQITKLLLHNIATIPRTLDSNI